MIRFQIRMSKACNELPENNTGRPLLVKRTIGIHSDGGSQSNGGLFYVDILSDDLRCFAAQQVRVYE